MAHLREAGREHNKEMQGAINRQPLHQPRCKNKNPGSGRGFCLGISYSNDSGKLPSYGGQFGTGCVGGA